MSGCEFLGVSGDHDCYGVHLIAVGEKEPISNLSVVNNHIHDTEIGIGLSNVVDSTVSGNHVIGNDFFGILLEDFSMDNVISSNTTSGNVVDLIHRPLSTPNTWTDNSCVSKVGADIPDC